MKLAYVIDTFPRKSELFLRREIDELRRQGVEIRVFSICRPAEGTGSIYRRRPEQSEGRGGRIVPVPFPNVTYLPRLSFDIPGILSAAFRIAGIAGANPRLLLARTLRSPAAAALASALETEAFDAVHAHFLGVASTLAMAASRMAGVPLTISAHADDIFRSGEAIPAKGRHARAVFACCRANVKELVRRRVPEEKIHVAYHGLPPAGTDTSRPSDPPLVLAMGRFVEKKGFEYLIAALRELPRWREDFRCVICGDGPLRGELEKEARATGIADRVEFPGWVDDDEKARLYSRAAVLVCPSVVAGDGDRDGVPNVILEAMAHGVPAVGTDAGGIPEAIDDGVTGIVVPQHDPALLVKGIGRILTDDRLREGMSENARALVADRFDLAKNVGVLREVWESY